MSRLLLFLFLILLPALIFSQTNEYQPAKIIQASPTASSLGRYGELPVSAYTGTASVNIPLYDISSGDVSLSIALNYFSTGVKVADNASWIGLGWALHAGGAITRTIRGLDDLYSSGSVGTGYYNADAIPSKYQVLTYDFAGLSSNDKEYFWQVRHGWIDTNPDLFNFSFSKYNGKFVLDKVSNGSKAYLDEQNDIEFAFNQSANQWVAIDGMGIKYYFGTIEKEQDYSSSSINSEVPNDQQIGAFDNYTINAPTVTTAWYIDSIVGPSGNSISFSYDKTTQSQSLISKTEEEYDMISVSLAGQSSGEPATFQGIYHRYNASKQVIQDVNLKKITFKHGTIEFLSTARDDIEYLGSTKPQKLSSILVKDGSGALIKTVSLYHSYFLSQTQNGSLQNDYTNRRRLKLDSVVESNAGIIKPAYKLTYFASEDLPYKYSKAIDHWGYYNNQTTNTTLLRPALISQTNTAYPGANRNASSSDDDGKKGMLSAIVYPTGAATALDYELNSYSNMTGEDQYDKQAQTAQVNSMIQTYTTSFDINSYDTALVTFTGNFKKSNDEQYIGDYGHIYKNGALIYSFQETQLQPAGTYSNPQVLKMTLLPGHYTMDVRNLTNITTSINASWQKRVLVTSRKGGGMRIKSVTNVVNGTEVMQRKFLYVDTDGKTTGKLISPVIYEYPLSAYQGPLLYGASWNYQYLGRMSNSISTPALSVNAGIIGYDSVIELNGANGEGGKTKYYYINQPDVIASTIFPFLPIIHNPLNGRPSRITVFDAADKKLNATEYGYVQRSVDYLPGLTMLPVLPDPSLSNGLPEVYYAPMCDFRYYQVPSYWLVTSTEIEKKFNGQDSVVSIKNYYYNNPIHKLVSKTTITNSKNENIIINNKYSSDYTLTGTINDSISKSIKTLQDLHINGLIEQYVQKSNSNGSNVRTISGSFTTYKTTIPYPAVKYNLETLSPLTNYQLSSITATTATFDSRYKPKLYSDNYDSYGNLLQQHKSEDFTHSYIWGYKNSLPIAEVTNAKSNEIYFNSFEESSDEWGTSSSPLKYKTDKKHGGDQAGFIDNPTVKTPQEIYVYSSKRLSLNLTASKKFHYSGWIYSDGPSAEIFLMMTTTVGGGYTSTSNIVSPTSNANKWVLVEKDIDVPANIKEIWLRVDNNGVGKVWFDDLRLYPADAQMTTYTYRPLIGMTSQSDVNNRITYYAYDGFGRLSSVKDKDDNIIKTYCYNYAGQLSNCRTSFQNLTQSKTFIKNDCTDTAFCGQEIDAVVTAGSFTSDNNQEEADSLALAYLNANGQTYANMRGECLPKMSLILSNYEHIAGFTIQFTSVVDSSKIYILDFPENADNTISLQKIPQGRYNILISKTNNAQSFMFTVSGPNGDIQVNSDQGSWVNVPVNGSSFNKIAIGIQE